MIKGLKNKYIFIVFFPQKSLEAMYVKATFATAKLFARSYNIGEVAEW